MSFAIMEVSKFGTSGDLPVHLFDLHYLSPDGLTESDRELLVKAFDDLGFESDARYTEDKCYIRVGHQTLSNEAEVEKVLRDFGLIFVT